MRFLKRRAITYISLSMVLVIFIGMLIITAASTDFSTTAGSNSVYIEGQYSINGGEWTKTIPDKMCNSDFNELVIKGNLSSVIHEDNKLIISATDAWFTLKADGKIISTNYRADNGVFKKTPGYSVQYVSWDMIKQNSELELYIKYPYTIFSSRKLADFFDMRIGDDGTVYEMLFQNKTLTILFCILICFLGLFAFPIAGIVLGGIDYKYLTFSILCFFSGLFILTQSIYSYLPIWINKPVLCMSICLITSHLFSISALVFLKVNLSSNRYKAIANLIIVCYLLSILAAFVMNFTGVSDFYASKAIVLILFGLFSAILTLMLLREARGNIKSLMVLISWLPLALTTLFDILNSFLGFADFKLLEVGTALTLFNQLVQLIFDLRKQYKEAIRYQQIQNELYEARVSIMVSQIQPHFLYNSLTSIAMMCTKDPKTAKTATINFADYLRGNMNSLKEKNPVPFERELEHLKKYIMLEQLRFGDMLNIEYDIQSTGFLLPQLSVQPLVENAIKHGVGMKEDGGTVKIATRETADFYEVIVSDDGVGFDTEKTVSDGREHVGMNNVKQRLKKMCGAELIIESTIGEGTTSTIRIPKKGGNI